MKLVKGDFVDGSAVVYKKENGFLVKGLQFQNNSIYWLPYQYIGDFYCNRAVIDTGKRMGYIDRLGNEVIPPIFSVANDFCEERAFVSHGDDTIIIDLTGNIVKSFPEPYVTSEFQNGTAILSRIVDDGNETEEAVVDHNGEFVVDFTSKRKINTLTDIHIHSTATKWHEGIMKFSRNGRCGVIDRFGNEVVNDFNGSFINSIFN